MNQKALLAFIVAISPLPSTMYAAAMSQADKQNYASAYASTIEQQDLLSQDENSRSDSETENRPSSSPEKKNPRIKDRSFNRPLALEEAKKNTPVVRKPKGKSIAKVVQSAGVDPQVHYTQKSLHHAFNRHQEHFGFKGSDWNNQMIQPFVTKITDHTTTFKPALHGLYRGQKALHYLSDERPNPLDLIFDENHHFIVGFKLSDEQLKVLLESHKI